MMKCIADEQPNVVLTTSDMSDDLTKNKPSIWKQDIQSLSRVLLCEVLPVLCMMVTNLMSLINTVMQRAPCHLMLKALK